MGEVAVRVAQAANYTNAGTVEFLVDQQKNFYFLEMNTRLQVEHPVTELTTGLDLVHLQIRIAAGEKLPFTQSDIQVRGHAIECRIYAEDPDNNYFPSPGKIEVLLQPSGPGIRRDSGMYEGWTVPMDYDPLLAKLIGFGTDRQQAIMRLERALYEYFVAGIKTNISLFQRILRDDDFRAAKLDTGYLDRLLAKKLKPTNRACRSMTRSDGDGSCNRCRHVRGARSVLSGGKNGDASGSSAGQLVARPTGNRRDVRKGCADFRLWFMKSLSEANRTGWSLKKLPLAGSAAWTGRLVHIDAVIPRRDVLSLLIDGRAYEIKREQTATDLHMWVGSTPFRG